MLNNFFPLYFQFLPLLYFKFLSSVFSMSSRCIFNFSPLYFQFLSLYFQFLSPLFSVSLPLYFQFLSVVFSISCRSILRCLFAYVSLSFADNELLIQSLQTFPRDRQIDLVRTMFSHRSKRAKGNSNLLKFLLRVYCKPRLNLFFFFYSLAW